MDITLPADLEVRLQQMAAESGRHVNQVVEELIVTQLDHDEWFHAEIEKGRASLKAGKFLTHEEVGERMSKYLGH